MRKIKFGNTLMGLSGLFFVVYNTYFGWNKLPMSDIESTCDTIFRVGLGVGIGWYFLPLLDVYESYIKSKSLPVKEDLMSETPRAVNPVCGTCRWFMSIQVTPERRERKCYLLPTAVDRLRGDAACSKYERLKL